MTQTPSTSYPAAWAPVFTHDCVLATNLDALRFDPETGWLDEDSPSLVITLHVGWGYRDNFSANVYYPEVNGGDIELDDCVSPEDVLDVLTNEVEYDWDEERTILKWWNFHGFGRKETR